MSNYTINTLVSVYPFTRQTDGEEVIIGIPENDVFVVLPHEAIELLDYLARGETIGKAKSIYQDKYGEIPDLDDLLSGLERRGFIAPIDHSFPDRLHQDSPRQIFQQQGYHFANFSQSLAQSLFSIPVLASYGFVIGLAIVLALAEPQILPTWKAYFFKENATLMVLALMAIDLITLFIHEMAHLIAARSVGVFCRLGISHRMWTVVAQTDMTGVWNVPRHKRYLPFLAGALIDLVSAAVLIVILFACHRGWLIIDPITLQLVQAWLLNYLMGLLWQGYFFMRTDFYYVFANFFGCKNLLGDTEVFVCNQISRIFPRIKPISQSHIPAPERRVIRMYAVLWLFGRTAAIATLIVISLPLMWHYCFSLFTTLSAGYSAQPYAFVDALCLLVIFGLTQGLGFGVWIWSFWKKPKLVNN